MQTKKGIAEKQGLPSSGEKPQLLLGPVRPTHQGQNGLARGGACKYPTQSACRGGRGYHAGTMGMER